MIFESNRDSRFSESSRDSRARVSAVAAASAVADEAVAAMEPKLICIVSANTGSLRAKTKENEKTCVSDGVGRTQLLEFDLDMHDVYICGIQEGRASDTQQITGVVYEQFIAAGDAKGCFGPQLWVRRSSPLRALSFFARSVRIIEVMIARGGEVWFAVSAHAPCEGATDVEKNFFYDDLSASVSKAKRLGYKVLLFLDANARIGSTLSPYIGRCEIDAENDNGARLRGFAETFHLKVVNSFF